jgi:hypothetical protein
MPMAFIAISIRSRRRPTSDRISSNGNDARRRVAEMSSARSPFQKNLPKRKRAGRGALL